MDDIPAQGLRARNKADRTRRILGAAARLFREVGFDAVRLEDIAQAGDVSVGTLYNYFETKGDILMAIVTMEVEEVLAEGASLVDRPRPGLQSSLDALVAGYYDHSLTYLSKDMWRRAMALSIEAPGTPFSQRYSDLDHRLAGQVSDLVAAHQAAGDVRPEISARTAGEVIFNNLNNMFIEFVKTDEMTLAGLKARVRAQNAMLVGALAPAVQALKAVRR